MIKSMTAFARKVVQTPHGDITWELKSVNHRYLENHYRVQESFRPFEIEFRNIVKSKVARGKIDCSLSFESNKNESADFNVNAALAKRLHGAAQIIADAVGEANNCDVRTLLRWPGVLSETAPDIEALSQSALEGLSAAMDVLIENREREGQKLAEQINIRLTQITSLIAKARELYPKVQQSVRDTLMTKLEEVLEKIDNDRLEQEMVHFAQRLDVSEELDRLDIHVSETQSVLKQKGSIGRRLDFLMQEFNREANTLGSKSQDSELTKVSVELKVLIEQIREQVQNIE